MAEQTSISWADKTWSPWYGCTQVSMGEQGACEGCYARFMSETRFKRVVFGGPGRGEGTRDVRAAAAWKEPLRWNREAAALERAWFAPDGPPNGGMGKPFPHRPSVFPSMCDPFDNHPALREPRRRFFELIHATPHLTWLLLTKRPGNIVKLFRETGSANENLERQGDRLSAFWPRNAAIGCTVVSQEEADRDIPKLLAAKAALQPAFAFLSMEPLLGPVDDLMPFLHPIRDIGGEVRRPVVDWVITGGETDQGPHRARPTRPAWVRSIRDQCAAAGVPYHHKQNGEWVSVSEVEGPQSAVHTWPDGDSVRRVGAKRSGRLLDGVVHDARPAPRP